MGGGLLALLFVAPGAAYCVSRPFCMHACQTGCCWLRWVQPALWDAAGAVVELLCMHACMSEWLLQVVLGAACLVSGLRCMHACQVSSCCSASFAASSSFCTVMYPVRGTPTASQVLPCLACHPLFLSPFQPNSCPPYASLSSRLPCGSSHPLCAPLPCFDRC